MLDAHSYLLGENALVVALHTDKPSPSEQRRLFALTVSLQHSNAFLDIVPAKASVTAYLADPSQYQYWLKKAMLLWEESEEVAFNVQTHHIDAIYGGEHGPDLMDVAQRLNLSAKQVVECHSEYTYQVEFLGFLPGFAYLGTLPDPLQLPRKSTPRKQVPKGSIAIAEDLSAIYPSSSPGGWHLLGHCSHTLFDPTANPPSLFAPGDKVIFIPNKEGIC
ncbi:5-oxoprolinase subunit PxpB [Pseudoalteromonas sp. JBTF-M23]|uniref:5-oxoprolinase subunit PxpB n=1 Tax=Pseudoalteromonas caenipelagi TaxID=2726988 RepID=A0A849V6A9_9GAMM|nr:5-oxoprolinase subunit PxpB [Pseudoalteromonas caenipelagi]NOU49029.1 5-oxoprolinase subunit PxpB [Pseudoalteromonas caenipelagi]